MVSPLVSVIIPTFNSSAHVQRCLDSIINQSLKNIEIIAIDDVSTDNTVKVLKQYDKKYDNFHLVQLNSKVLAGGARNVGLERAKGEYISLIDSDDWIDSNYFYYMVGSTRASDADITLCGVIREYENGHKSVVRYGYDVQNTIDGKYAISLLSNVINQDISISAIVGNKLFKKSFLNKYKLKFYENCLNEDDIFIFHAFLEAESISITDKTNYHIFQRKTSVSRCFSTKHIDDLFFAFTEIRKLLDGRQQFPYFMFYYYSFFEKCLAYLIESLQISEQDDEVIGDYIKYTFSLEQNAIRIDEFIEYCGANRIFDFIKNMPLSRK